MQHPFKKLPTNDSRVLREQAMSAGDGGALGINILGGRGRAGLLCGIVAVAVIAVYNALYFADYSPLPEGWFSLYGKLIRSGEVPYRDFYFFLPPLYPLFIAGIQLLFGEGLMPLRVCGVLMVLACAASLYRILLECFGSLIACFATVAAIIYFQSGVAHIGYDFFQLMTMSTLMAGVCLHGLDREQQAHGETAKGCRRAIMVGLLGAVAIFTKHSNGLFITIALAVGVCWIGLSGGRERAFRNMFWFTIGFGIVAVAMLFWLLVTSSFWASIRMMFGGAAASKGGLGQALFGFLSATFNGDLASRLMQILILGIPLGFTPIWMLRRTSRVFSKSFDEPLFRTLTLTVGVIGLLVAILVPRFREGGVFPWVLEALGNYGTLSMIPAALLGTSLVVFSSLFAVGRRAREPEARPLLLAAIVSVGMLWGNGTSGGLSEGGAFLGVALFIGILLSHGGFYGIGAAVVSAVVCLQSTIYVEVKLRAPYNWWGVMDDDVRQPHEPAKQPLLRGLLVTPARNALYDEIVDVIRRETFPGEPILVFPSTPIFYLLADRPMVGKAVVHWFDFLPDQLAENENALLRAEPPTLIVLLDMPEVVWSTHEQLFRGGARCAQRQMLELINDWESRGVYQKIATFPVVPASPGLEHSFRILKRSGEGEAVGRGQNSRSSTLLGRDL